MCVCALFQVITHISTGLYVYKLKLMCLWHTKSVTGKNVTVHKAMTGAYVDLHSSQDHIIVKWLDLQTTLD